MATVSGMELRRCCNSWSVVVDGTRRPCLFPAHVGGDAFGGGDGLTCGQTADDASASDGRVHDGDDIAEFCLECRVKVGRGVHGGEAVTVCEFGEHANVAAVFELDACNRVRWTMGRSEVCVRLAMGGWMGRSD